MNLSTRTTKNFAILVLSIGFSCITLAQTKPAVVDPNKAPIAAAGIDEVYQLVDAVVTKVDSKTRTVTLKDKDGTVTNFVAGCCPEKIKVFIKESSWQNGLARIHWWMPLKHRV
ncbi:MAG: hypothetical protein EBX07_04100 [Burkholderiaceae bacterium]|nr:hypothetical protein [Burkholderiaceae bacterium]